MTEVVYDVPISEVVKLLDKSDRQVRRYVKEKRVKANPVRIDGHIKLMFNREEVLAFAVKLAPELETKDEEPLQAKAAPDEVVTVDMNDIDMAPDEAPAAVKYAIDSLRDQIRDLRDENKDLHYQLEQRSGQVGFLQGKIEMLQEEIKALAPMKKEVEEPEVPEVRKPWYKRLFGG